MRDRKDADFDKFGVKGAASKRSAEKEVVRYQDIKEQKAIADQNEDTYGYMEFGRYFSWQREKENSQLYCCDVEQEVSGKIGAGGKTNGEEGFETKPRLQTRVRHKTSPKQLSILEKVSETILKPDRNLRQKLSSELGMTQRQVQIWFQNKRAKLKKMKEMRTSVSAVTSRKSKKRTPNVSEGKAEELYSALETPIIEQTPPAVYENRSGSYGHIYYQNEQFYYPPPQMYPPHPYACPSNYYILPEKYDSFDPRYRRYIPPTGATFDTNKDFLEGRTKNANVLPNDTSYYQNNVYYSRHPSFYQNDQNHK